MTALAHAGPLDARAPIAFLARRAIPGVEEVVDGAYRRSLRLPHGAGVVELRPAGNGVLASLWLDDERDRDAALGRCRRLLDLDRDPRPAARRLGADPLLGPVARRAPARRVPGCVDGAELALRAVLGQQVSLAGAATLAGRLVAARGEPLARPVGAVTHLFPAPGAVAGADPEALAMPRARGRALVGLAAALAGGELELHPGADPATAERRLLALPGIGPWTAAYVAMRALHDADAFLATDLGVLRALARLGEDGGAAAAARLGERWRPYRAYAVQHLWGLLAEADEPVVGSAA